MAEDTKVKICGIRTVEAARVAVENGADMVGLVFYWDSPRYLTYEEADELVAGIAELPQRPALVGLFVNASTEEMMEAVDRYKLDYLQLSGYETVEQVAEISPIKPVLKTVRLPAQVEPDKALQEAAPFGNLPNVTILLDTGKEGMYGGTGEVGNWMAARVVAKRYQTMLAGGLNPLNVASAVWRVKPWGVDVSSGVERDGFPGEKDPYKIAQFCRAVKVSGAELPDNNYRY